MNIDDTIVAISSPPGMGERGIVRLSGAGAGEILNRIFISGHDQQFGFDSSPARHEGTLRIDGEVVAAAVIRFPEGRSYTGQALIEIHLLGAPTLLGMVVEACLESGARRAEPGEFTARAFLSGRLDLSQACGVAGMIAARSDQQLLAAERLLHGRLGEVAIAVREDLADLLSLVEGAMDFADEPIEFIDVPTLQNRLTTIRDRLAETADAGLRAERWGQLPRVVLVGRPNAGKSSLLNRLSGSERAISSPVAGTTRDALSATVDLGGLACLMMDVAGLMELDAGESGDSIGAKAGQMAAHAESTADLLVVVFDMTTNEPIDDTVRPWRAIDVPQLIVANKSDCASQRQIDAFEQWCALHADRSGIIVSAMTGSGCDALKDRLAALLQDRADENEDATIALMAEHRDALENALQAMDRAIALAASCDSQLQDADLVATEMRIAAEALGALVGMDHTEEMLGRIFSRFCVGK